MTKLGYCGLNCEGCPVLIATVNDDNALRQATAKAWSQLYAGFLKDELKTQDMNCSGCQSENERLFVGCRDCPIRGCCGEKGFSSCALCAEYETCGMLIGFFTQHQQAKDNLDRLRAG